MQQLTNSQSIFEQFIRQDTVLWVSLHQSIARYCWGVQCWAILQVEFINKTLQHHWLRQFDRIFLEIPLHFASDIFVNFTNLFTVKPGCHLALCNQYSLLLASNQTIVNPRYPYYQSVNRPIEVQTRIRLASAVIHAGKRQDELLPKCNFRLLQSVDRLQ